MPRLGDFTRQKTQAPAEYHSWKNDPSEDNYEALLTKMNPTVTSALRSYGGDQKGLKVRAKILTAQAFDTYDPERGTSLSTHIHNSLQRLHRYRSDRSSALHIPENTRLDAGLIKKYVAEYEASRGEEPSDAMISDGIGLSLAKIQRARNIGEASSSQMLSDKGDLPASKGKTAEEIWADYVYHDLGEKDKKIYQWTTGYNGSPMLNKRAIAIKLKISPAAVSQRIGRIVNKLQEYRR